MTPTEQDKEPINASDEPRVDLVTAPEDMCEHGVNLRLCNCHRCDGTAIYAEADMKRVALEARIDENEAWYAPGRMIDPREFVAEIGRLELKKQELEKL